MSDGSADLERLPVNLKKLKERMLLQAELIRTETELRNFGLWRERLSALGEDPKKTYRAIEAQRQHILERLKKFRSHPSEPSAVALSRVHGRDESLLSLPIAPGNFSGGLNFGFAGSVQMGAPNIGFEVVPEGVTGSFRTLYLGADGQISWDGEFDAAPADPQPKSYFLLYHWVYLVSFPAPPITSTLTYGFEVPMWTSVDVASGPSVIPTVFWSWVAIDEKSSFPPPGVFEPGTFVGWPVVEKLPYSSYYQFPGDLKVRRSFEVEAGNNPSIAVTIGVALNMESGAHAQFDSGSNIIMPGSVGISRYDFGIVNFHYTPILVSV